MNSRKLIIDTIEGREVSRTPCGPLAVHFCAAEMGITISEYSTDANQLAQSVIRYYEKYRPDAVWVSSDTWVSAQAMGAEVIAPGPEEPFAGRNEGFIHSIEDIKNIPQPDPYSQGRQPIMLEAIRQVKKSLGEDVFVVGCFDQAPFSLACAVGGISNIMLKTITDPEFVQALLERCTKYAICYAQAMAQCGADMLSTGDSPAGLVGPELYRSHCLPAVQHVFETLRKTTRCKLSLHICGDATAILPDIGKSGADVIELDQSVDFQTACKSLPDNMALWGNIDPVGVMLRGTPEDVQQVAQQLLEQAATAKRRFVLSSGCTLAPGTPPENIHSLIRCSTNRPAQ